MNATETNAASSMIAALTLSGIVKGSALEGDIFKAKMILN
jgi:hypothetical protein